MAAAPRPYPTNNFLPNGASAGGGGPPPQPGVVPTGAVPGATPLLPNQGRIVQTGSIRVLCVADVRGNLISLNELAKTAKADYIVHTGDFGFYDDRSLDRIADKTLKHVAQYSPLLTEDIRRQIASFPPSTPIKENIPRNQLPLSQLTQFLAGTYKFDVPVYAVWGACEDVQVLEKLRSGEYKIDNLHILDEAHSRLLEIGGVKLRLLGLGGALVMHKLFDNGEGRTTIAGGQGTMWTTLLQMGELIDTANRTYDPTETRVLVTHASPSREGLLNQLAVALKADFSISGGLHFRYGSSYNEFSVNPTLDHFRGKLAASKASFQDVWDTVKSEVEPIVAENEAHQKLLHNALEVVNKMPAVATGGHPFGGQGQVDEAAFKNMWNFNLADAAYGFLVLDIENGRIGTEMKALGFNFSHRGLRSNQQAQDALKANTTLPAAPSPAANIAPAAPSQVAQPTVPAVAPTAPTASAPVAATQQNTPSAAPQTRPAQQPRGQAPAPAAQQTLPARSNQQSPAPAPPAPVAQGGANTTAATAPVPAARPVSQAPQSHTPKPAATPVTNGTPAPTESKANGFSPAPQTDGPAAQSQIPPKEPSSGIFVENCSSPEEVKKLFSEQDQLKIQRVERVGQHGTSWHVRFASPEEMQAVLAAVSDEYKNKVPAGKPRMKPFENRSRYGPYSGRGGYQGGYKSGGASDSEGARGGTVGGTRGGTFRGARGGRGGERGGERGRGGRGRGSGRPEGASPAPAAGS